MEDALPLLESLGRALEREEPGPDDLVTLQEGLSQLPRLDQALERAIRHEPARVLVEAVKQRRARAQQLGNRRLAAASEADQASLRAVVARVLFLARRQGSAPRPGETILYRSTGQQTGLAVIIGLAVGLLAVGQGFATALMVGTAAAVVAMFALPARPWVLLTDRVHFPPRRGTPSIQLPIAALRTLEAGKVRWAGEEVKLLSPAAQLIALYAEVLSGRALGDLDATPGPHVLLDAHPMDGGRNGRALISAAGVLFAPWPQRAALHAALSGRPAPNPLPLDTLLLLVAHVPLERAGSVGQALARAAQLTWLPAGGLTVEREGPHFTLRGEGGAVTVRMPLKERSNEHQAAKQVLAQLGLPP